MKTKKYILLKDETLKYKCRTLYRIQYNDGTKGGWLQSYDNLSQEGDCRVLDNAKVYDNANVCDNSKVRGNAEVFGYANVFDNSNVFGNAEVFEYANVFENSKVCGNSKVFGKAKVYDNSNVFGYAKVFGESEVFEFAKVFGNSKVFGKAEVCGFAIIEDMQDYIVFKNWWSSGRYFTWLRSENRYKVGYFYGTGEELIAKAYKESEQSGREYERIVQYVNTILN